MSATEDFAASYANYLKALKEANAMNKAALFSALSEAAITRIVVEFDGEGDSGQLNNVAAYCGEDLRDIPGGTVELRQISWGADKHDTSNTPLHEAVEQLCYDFLEQEHGGWENNDGAYGEFLFDVPQQRIELDFNARYWDTVNTTHMF